MLIAVIVIALAAVGFTGGFTSLWSAIKSAAGTSASSSPSKSPGTRPVIKGTKPKGATACKATYKSSLTPKRSAKGPGATCAVAERVRKEYIQSGKAGRTFALKIGKAGAKGSYTVNCKGAKTVTCKNSSRTVYLY